QTACGKGKSQAGRQLREAGKAARTIKADGRIIYMAQYRYVFFDLDGTISNSYEGIARSLDATFEHYGIKVDKSLYPAYIGPPLSDTFRLYFPAEKVSEVVGWFRDNYVKGDIFRNPVYEGIPQV